MRNNIYSSIIKHKKQVHRTSLYYLRAGDGDLPFRKRSGGSFSGKSGEAMLSPDRSLAITKSRYIVPAFCYLSAGDGT